jgi:hypothetical protein
MKKRIIIILFAALLLFACQPTPDEPIVLQKDQDLMIQQGAATLSPEQPYMPPEVPERFAYEYREGTLTVHIDAPVTVPNDPLPIIHVRACGYDQEAVKRVFALLADGDTLMTSPEMKVTTKEEYETAIQLAMQAFETGSNKDGDFTEEEWKASIERLKEAYNAAPFADELPKPTVADGTFYPNWERGIQYDCADARSKDRRFRIHSSEGATFLLFEFDDLRSPAYTMSNAKEVNADSELPEELRMTYGDAVRKLNTLIEATSEPFRIKRVYLIDDEQQGTVDGIYAEANHYALAVQCQRTYENVPIATDVASALAGNELYTCPWKQESLWIVLDQDGFVSFDWLSPIATGRTRAETTKLMPFSEIREIAEKMFRVLYLQYTDPQNVNIEHIEIDLNVSHVDLELMRVREQDKTEAKQGLLIPAWVFYGTIMKTTYEKDGSSSTIYSHYNLNSGNMYYEGDVIVLCINAIDGSIIDPMLGY